MKPEIAFGHRRKSDGDLFVHHELMSLTLRSIKNSQSVIVLGGKGMGKSSLLYALRNNMGAEPNAPSFVYVDASIDADVKDLVRNIILSIQKPEGGKKKLSVGSWISSSIFSNESLLSSKLSKPEGSEIDSLKLFETQLDSLSSDIGKRYVIAIDNLDVPLLLVPPEVAVRLLEWLRHFRQKYSAITWILTVSQEFLFLMNRQRSSSSPLNDLQVFSLDPLSRNEALRYTRLLLNKCAVRYEDEVPDEIVSISRGSPRLIEEIILLLVNTEKSDNISIADIKKIIRDLVMQQVDTVVGRVQSTFDSLGPKERRVAVSVFDNLSQSRESQSFYPVEITERDSFRRIIDKLVSKGLLEYEGPKTIRFSRFLFGEVWKEIRDRFVD